MSHIVRATIDIALKDRELLTHALEAIGTVKKNDKITVAGISGTYSLSQENYDIVLESQDGHKFRLGFNEEDGLFVPYADEWGRLGQWVEKSLAKAKDHYLAQHYARELENEGFSSEIITHQDGSLEVLATETVW